MLQASAGRHELAKKIFGSVTIVLAVVFAGFLLVGYKYWQVTQASKQGPPPEMPTTVHLTRASKVSFRQTSSTIGTVVAPRAIVLSNEVPGTVSSVHLIPGTIVDEGTVLVELDSRVELAQLEAAVAEAKLARSRFQRIQQVQQSRASTESELEEAAGQMEQSEARVAELRAVLERKRLKAPFKARIGLSDTHEGQYLPAGTEITSLQGVDDYQLVDFSLPQHVADSIEVEQTIQVMVGPESFESSIIALDVKTDRLTRNLVARARLDNPPGSLKPGDSVRVYIEYGPEVAGISIPLEAVRRSPNGAHVFVAKASADGSLRAESRLIQIQKTVNGRAFLTAGLQHGEQVVAAGSFKLLDGGLIVDAATSQTDSPS